MCLVVFQRPDCTGVPGYLRRALGATMATVVPYPIASMLPGILEYGGHSLARPANEAAVCADCTVLQVYRSTAGVGSLVCSPILCTCCGSSAR